MDHSVSDQGWVEREVVINNQLGLHARPAALFVQTANQYQAQIEVTKGDETVDGKSIMSILTLAVGTGTLIKIRVSGDDASEAVEALVKLIETNFGEIS